VEREDGFGEGGQDDGHVAGGLVLEGHDLLERRVEHGHGLAASLLLQLLLLSLPLLLLLLLLLESLLLLLLLVAGATVVRRRLLLLSNQLAGLQRKALTQLSVPTARSAAHALCVRVRFHVR
jgi:hypothetical protein